MASAFEKLYGISGKTAAITGGGGVLCGTIAEALGAVGCKVAVMDIVEANAPKVADSITKAGGQAIPVVANVLDTTSIKAACDKITSKFGRVDILINGA